MTKSICEIASIAPSERQLAWHLREAFAENLAEGADAVATSSSDPDHAPDRTIDGLLAREDRVVPMLSDD